MTTGISAKNGKQRSGARLARPFLEKLIAEPMSFACMLRSIRECDEVSQAELARRLGISRAHICDIEKGRNFLGPERAANFAKVLGYSPEQFVRLALQDQVYAAGLRMTVKVEAAEAKPQTKKCPPAADPGQPQVDISLRRSVPN